MTRLSSTRPLVAAPDYTEVSPIAQTIPAATSRPVADTSLPVQRLVVLVPDAAVEEGRLGAKLWSLASPLGLSVLLLGLVRDTAREARAQRRLAAIASIGRDKHTQFETRVGIGTRWEPLVESIWQVGDLLVCHAEQSRSTWGIGREPLAPVLASSLKIPVYAVAGFYPELRPDLPEWSSRFLAIIPLVILLAGFLVVLVGIQRFTTGPAQPVLLCLAVVIEYVLIAAWETFATHQSIG